MVFHRSCYFFLERKNNKLQKNLHVSEWQNDKENTHEFPVDAARFRTKHGTLWILLGKYVLGSRAILAQICTPFVSKYKIF
jgi:hypothetical protein